MRDKTPAVPKKAGRGKESLLPGIEKEESRMKRKNQFEAVYAGPGQMPPRNREKPSDPQKPEPRKPYPWNQAEKTGPRMERVYAGPPPRAEIRRKDAELREVYAGPPLPREEKPEPPEEPKPAPEAGIRSVYAGPRPKKGLFSWLSRRGKK